MKKFILFTSIVFLLILGSVPNYASLSVTTETQNIIDSNDSKISNDPPQTVDVTKGGLDKTSTSISSDNFGSTPDPSDDEISTSASDVPIIRKVIMYNTNSMEPINYATPGLGVDVAVLLTGPLVDADIKIQVRRDIVAGIDTVLGHYTFDNVNLADNTTEQWFNVTGFTIDNDRSLFGYDGGDIRSYYVRVSDTSPLINNKLFEGGMVDNGGTGTGFLYTYGTVTLHGIQYFNASNNVPIEVSENNWNLTAEVYLSISNAPIWDFSLYVNFKYDIVFSIDSAVLTDQAISVFSLANYGIVSPGDYTYTPIDVDGYRAYIYLDEDRNYGSDLGQTRSVYGNLQLGDAAVTYLNDVGHSNEQSFSAISVISNVVEMAPIVKITSPIDGDIVNSDTLEIEARILDQNSNYLVESILINGTEVIADYNPLTGRLVTTYTIPSTMDNQIFNIEIVATDNKQKTGSDMIIIQKNNPAGFLPDGYINTSAEVGENLLDLLFYQSSEFNYSNGDNLDLSISPIFSVGFSVDSMMDIYISSPDELEAGEKAEFYAAISNPEIVFTMNFSLDVRFEFSYNDRYFSGLMNVYFQEHSKSLLLPLGVSGFTLDDIIGPDKTARLTEFDLKLSDLIPAIGWLGDVVLSLDIEHLFKQVGEVSADVSIVNGQADITRLKWQDTNPKVIPVTSDISDAGQLDFSLTNMKYHYRFGVEVYFQLTLSGRILTFTLGPYDLNEWMAENLGVIIPSLDEWLLDLSYAIPGSVTISSTLTGRDMSVAITAISRSGDSQTVKVQVKSHGLAVKEATLVATFMEQNYVGTETNDGYYLFDLDRHSGNESLVISATKTGYSTQVLEGFIDVYDTATEYETVTSVSNQTETIEGTATTTSTIEEVNSVFTTIIEETVVTNAKSEASLRGQLLIAMMAMVAIPMIRRRT